jgi:hypothetical protein
LELLEYYRLWKQLGGFDLVATDARVADAILVLEQVWQEEEKDGKV